MSKMILSFGFLVVTVLLSLSLGPAFAHPHPGQIMTDDHLHEPQSEIIPLNGMMGLEKSTVSFYAPGTNSLPWGFVEGKIANHVEGYPVVIQIFKDDDAVHFAQTDVEADGTYEYKFRVLSSDNAGTNKAFEGDYLVQIFKVVYLTPENTV